MRVQDKVAVVTGASAGIGRNIAETLAAEGARVILTDINETDGNKVAEAIRTKGDKASFIKHDVAAEREWQAVAETVASQHDGIDILVNNAGIYTSEPLEEINVDQWDNLMGINVRGVFLGVKSMLPLLRRGHNSSIINLSSVAGLRGASNQVLYCASKGAVRLMTKAMAAELAPDKIRVNSVHPGLIATEMADQLLEQRNMTEGEYAAETMLAKIGHTEDIAQAVLYLAADESRYVTAQELAVDGGLTQ